MLDKFSRPSSVDDLSECSNIEEEENQFCCIQNAETITVDLFNRQNIDKPNVEQDETSGQDVSSGQALNSWQEEVKECTTVKHVFRNPKVNSFFGV